MKNKKNHGPTRVNADTFSVLLQHVTQENQATRLPLVSPAIREDYRRFIDACSSDAPYDVCFESLKGLGGTESATVLNLGCGWKFDAFEATEAQRRQIIQGEPMTPSDIGRNRARLAQQHAPLTYFSAGTASSMAFQERTLSTLTSFITAAVLLSCPSQLSTGQNSFSGWSV